MNRNLRARDIMSEGVQCIREDQSLVEASRMMRDLNVGCLPICGADERLQGLITDRDIVIKCCAEGMDPSRMRAGELSGTLHWIDAEANAQEAVDTMEIHQIKRLPVIDVAERPPPRRHDHRGQPGEEPLRRGHRRIRRSRLRRQLTGQEHGPWAPSP